MISEQDNELEATEVRQALDSILSSEPFKNSEKLRAFLTHIVTVTLAGEAQKLKGYSIAIDVLGRDESFDAEKDSVVRVNANRLRAALEEYYKGEGARDPVVVSVPKGGYVPKFERRTDTEHQQTPEKSGLLAWFRTQPKMVGRAALGLVVAVAIGVLAGGWITNREPAAQIPKPKINTIAIVPIEFDDKNEAHKRLAHSLTLDFVSAFEQGKILSVALADRQDGINREGFVELSAKMQVRFFVTGALIGLNQEQREPQRLSLSLVDGHSGFTTWSESYQLTSLLDDANYKTFLEKVSFDLKPAYYSAAKQAVEAEGTDNSSAVELFLISNFVPGAAVSSLAFEKERVALAQQALKIDPTYGPAHSVLADKLAYLATIDPPSDTQELLEASARHADLALTYAGETPDAIFNMAIHKLHIGDMLESERFARRAAKLDPKNARAQSYAEQVQYTCREVPEAVRWGRISEEQFQSPSAAYQLMAALVQTGDVAAARAIFAKQKRLWPNLDAHHYANFLSERLCNSEGDATHFSRIFTELAQALE